MTNNCPDCQAVGIFLEQIGFRVLFECPNGHPHFYDYIENCIYTE